MGFKPLSYALFHYLPAGLSAFENKGGAYKLFFPVLRAALHYEKPESPSGVPAHPKDRRLPERTAAEVHCRTYLPVWVNSHHGPGILPGQRTGAGPAVPIAYGILPCIIE